MNKLQWLIILVVGLTAFGVSYFIFAVPTQIKPEINEPAEVVEEEENINTEKPQKTDDKKSQCGNGVCTPPENADLCPADCS